MGLVAPAFLGCFSTVFSIAADAGKHTQENIYIYVVINSLTKRVQEFLASFSGSIFLSPLFYLFSIHSQIHSFIYSFIHSFIHLFIHSFIHSFIFSIDWLIARQQISRLTEEIYCIALPSFFIYSFIHSFSHSFIHLFSIDWLTARQQICRLSEEIYCIALPGCKMKPQLLRPCSGFSSKHFHSFLQSSMIDI